jgi:hypothetical protein
VSNSQAQAVFKLLENGLTKSLTSVLSCQLKEVVGYYNLRIRERNGKKVWYAFHQERGASLWH